jgi:hypothetical protein
VLTSSVVYPVVKSKTITLAFASSLLNTQQKGVRAKTGWRWISSTVSEWNDMSTSGLLLVKLKSSLRNEQRPGKCLRQVVHIRGDVRHRYAIAVNQAMVATVIFSKWWLQLYQQQSTGRHVVSLGHSTTDSTPTSLCSYSFLLSV